MPLVHAFWQPPPRAKGPLDSVTIVEPLPPQASALGSRPERPGSTRVYTVRHRRYPIKDGQFGEIEMHERFGTSGGREAAVKQARSWVEGRWRRLFSSRLSAVGLTGRRNGPLVGVMRRHSGGAYEFG